MRQFHLLISRSRAGLYNVFNMSREKFPTPLSSDEEYRNELERKKEVRRENRVREIAERRSAELVSLFPDEAENFEVVYEKIHEYWSSLFEDITEIRSDDQPAYGMFIRLKSSPASKYMIEHMFRQDLDAQKATSDMLSRQSFADNITKAVEQLKRRRGKR